MAFYKIFSIPKGNEATLTADAFLTVGTYGRVAQPGSGTQYAPVEISASATAVVGPFNEDRDYFLRGDNGDIAVTQVYSGVFTQEDDDGDVEGPASATDNALVRFDATTGKLIQNSGVLVSDANAMTGVASIVANGNIAAGKSGTAGTLSSFPATASKGSLKLVGVANTGNTDVTISNAEMGQASVISIPDPGAATDEFVLKAANDTALGLKAPLADPTFTGTVVLPADTSIGDVSATEISYVDGVTSAIQTQLDDKAPLVSPSFTTPTLGVVASGDISACTSTSMVMVTPVLGAASATSINFGQDALNYYDEIAVAGTPPSITFATPGDLSWVPTNNNWRVTRIGRQVFIVGRIAGTPTYTTSSGNIRITNLPFAAASQTGSGGGTFLGVVMDINGITYPAGKSHIFCLAVPGQSYLELMAQGSGSGAVALTTTEFPTAVALDLYFSLSYYTS